MYKVKAYFYLITIERTFIFPSSLVLVINFFLLLIQLLQHRTYAEMEYCAFFGRRSLIQIKCKQKCHKLPAFLLMPQAFRKIFSQLLHFFKLFFLHNVYLLSFQIKIYSNYCIALTSCKE